MNISWHSLQGQEGSARQIVKKNDSNPEYYFKDGGYDHYPEEHLGETSSRSDGPEGMSIGRYPDYSN